MSEITGVRVDFNCPVNNSGEIKDASRIKSHVPTLEKIDSEKIVIMTHQGRPDRSDFISTKTHAKQLEGLVGEEVEHIGSTNPSTVASRVKSSENKYIMIENTRMFEDEMRDYKNSQQAAKSEMVSVISECLDRYINDAFSVSHRNHASIIGFPCVVNSNFGSLFKKETSEIKSISDSETLYCIGGSKINDKITYLYELLNNCQASKVLVSGLVANVLLSEFTNFTNCNYSIPSEVLRKIEVGKLENLIEKNKIVLPIDLAAEGNEERKECSLEEFQEDTEAFDIGKKTIDKYKQIVKESSSVVCIGPSGIYEREIFSVGTRNILQAVSEHDSGLIAGGDTISASNKLNVDGFTYVSNGGGATLAYLSKGTLPAIQSIKF